MFMNLNVKCIDSIELNLFGLIPIVLLYAIETGFNGDSTASENN